MSVFGRIVKHFSHQKLGRLLWYPTNTVKYPPGVACILTDADEVNLDDWRVDNTGNQSSLSTTVGEMKTIIGVFYPSFYIGSRGNWTETEIREALTNDIEKAIYNFSDGNTKLVGPNGGHVMLFETPPIPGPPGAALGGFVNDIQCAPNTNTDSNGYMMPCNDTGSNGALTRASQLLESACPECDVKAALILACPKSNSIQPPGQPYPLRGRATFGSLSWTWTDGMVGWNSTGTGDPCTLAPGSGPGGYILENYIELIENGRVKRVLLHEIMHSLNWGHTEKPQIANTWCPASFKYYGPKPPCDDGSDSAYHYWGADNLCLMALGAGCSNPYNVVEMHPTASTKYLRGVHSQGVDGIWLPDNAVLSLDPSVGETHTIRLYAHDTPTTVKEDNHNQPTLQTVAGTAGGGPSTTLLANINTFETIWVVADVSIFEGLDIPAGVYARLTNSEGATEVVQVSAYGVVQSSPLVEWVLVIRGSTPITALSGDTLQILHGGSGGTPAISTGEGHIPYLIKIKRPLSLEHCGSDQYCLVDHDLFISYRREAWYSKKEQWNSVGGPPAQYWEEGGYQNGAMIIDWGPISTQWDQSVGGAGVLSLYKYDAADVRTPNQQPNQTLYGYWAEDGSPNSTTTGLVQWPRLEIKIIENVGNNPPANSQAYSGQGPPSIVVEIKAV